MPFSRATLTLPPKAFLHSIKSENKNCIQSFTVSMSKAISLRHSIQVAKYQGIQGDDTLADITFPHVNLEGNPFHDTWLALRKLPTPVQANQNAPTHMPQNLDIGRCRRNRQHSAPSTETPPASNLEIRHPIQLLPEQRHINFVKVKYCEDTRPKNQLEASKHYHHNLCHDISRASAQVTLHTILLGMGGVIYTPHTLEPLKELGLNTHTATRLALNLHAHSVQYAYKPARNRRALERTSFNPC
eukprot:1136520-Pelagomonas_calceolata.AAC.1